MLKIFFVVLMAVVPAQSDDRARPIQAAKPNDPCQRSPKWTPEEAGRYLSNCKQAPLDWNSSQFLKRQNRSGTWSLNCKPTRIKPGATSWEACPPQRTCNAKEAGEINLNDTKKLAKNQKNCTKKVFGAGLAEEPLADSKLPACSIPMETSKINRVVIHQSAGSQSDDAARVQEFHKGQRKWADIGYHFLIAKDAGGKWKVFEGRPLKPIATQGAHVGTGLNANSLGIMIAGSYSGKSRGLKPAKSALVPPPEAVALLGSLFQKLKSEYPIKEVVPHGEVKLKGSGCAHDCPGVGCKSLVAGLKSSLGELQ